MTCYKPCRSKTLSERGCTGFTLSPKYFWKPLTCGYVAAGAFFPQKRGPIFLETPNLWVHCRRRFFCHEKPRKKAPYFWKPLTCGYVAAGAFFVSTKKGPIFLGTDPPDLGTDHEGTARKSAASRQGRNGRVFNKARNIGISGI